MSFNGKVTLIILSLIFDAFIFDLLRRKKLNTEYSLWWFFITGVVVLTVLNEKIILKITSLIGAIDPTSTLTLMGLAFIFFMLIYLSTKISQLTNNMKNIAQDVTLLKNDKNSNNNES